MRALRRFGTLGGFAAITLLFSLLLPETFPTARNLLNITQQVSMLSVVAFSMTIVMVMGDFDLSVGAMASLSGVLAAVLFSHHVPVPLALLAALLAGLAGGLVNGLLVAVLGILPFVATLGTLTMYSGAAFLVSGGKTIFGTDIPSDFADFAKSGVQFGGVTIPALTLVAAAVLALVWCVLEQTAFGRRLYAIGGNAEAARLAGVPVRRLRIAAFALTGLGAAGAGLMYAARVASANPTQGDGLMLNAIAAVFLGMTLSEEGEPHVMATLVGVLMLAVLDNGLTQLAIDSYVREIMVGAIILAAVGVAGLGRIARR